MKLTLHLIYKNLKPKPKQLPTGPDLYLGGDGLPDWMQFTITVGMFAILYWVFKMPTLDILRLAYFSSPR